jgi:glycosyltransferase involved in cell wall biosynthesis
VTGTEGDPVPRTRKSRPDLLWLTNIPTPYTVPVWRELARLCELEVACLAAREENRAWAVDTSGVNLTVLSAPRVRVGYERTLYGPSLRLQSLVNRRPRVVLIDGWESLAAAQAMLMAKACRVPVVLSYWSIRGTHQYASGPVAAYRRLFFSGANHVLTPGIAATNAALALGVPSERIIQGVASVDVDAFVEASKRLRTACGAIGQGHRYLYVGQLVPRKNVEALVDAFLQVREAQDSLAIVGDGPLRQELQARAARGAGASVAFLGHLGFEELVRAYASADSLVLPSLVEVWGLVVNEALVSGLTAVVTPACGVTETVSQMPGVVVAAGGTCDEIGQALIAARSVPGTPPGTHPISAHTPAAMARVIAGALGFG